MICEDALAWIFPARFGFSRLCMLLKPGCVRLTLTTLALDSGA